MRWHSVFGSIRNPPVWRHCFPIDVSTTYNFSDTVAAHACSIHYQAMCMIFGRRDMTLLLIAMNICALVLFLLNATFMSHLSAKTIEGGMQKLLTLCTKAKGIEILSMLNSTPRSSTPQGPSSKAAGGFVLVGCDTAQQIA